MAEFNCTGCGLCCVTIGVMVENAKRSPQDTELLRLAAAFPHKYDEKGRCEKLTEDNKCSIYDSRPLICNVKEAHKNFFHHMSQDEFYKANEQVCKDMQDEHKNQEP